MKSFMIGRLLDPEIRTISTKDGDRKVLSLAILSGRTSVPFDVWGDDDKFEDYCKFSDGDLVCAIVNSSVNKRGYLSNYLNNMAFCPDDLRDNMMSLFK